MLTFAILDYVFEHHVVHFVYIHIRYNICTHILIDLCSSLCNLDVNYMVKIVRLTIINMRSVLEFAMEEPSRNRGLSFRPAG
jgi:hypothetical protein